MRLKIISDGTAMNTTIVDALTGERVEGITAIDFSINANGLTQAVLDFENIPCDITAEFKPRAKPLALETEETDDITGLLDEADMVLNEEEDPDEVVFIENKPVTSGGPSGMGSVVALGATKKDEDKS